MAQIPVGKSLAYAVAFLFGQFGEVVRLSWAALLLAGAVGYFAADMMLSAMIAALETRDPASAAALVGALFLGLLAIIACFLLYAIPSALLTRAALGLPVPQGAVQLTIDREVWRLFGAYLLYIAILVGVMLAASIIAGVLAGIVAVAAGAATGIALATMLVFTAVLVVGVRLGFFLTPVVIAEEKLSLLRAWRLSEGHLLRLVPIWLVAGAPVILLQLATNAMLPAAGLAATEDELISAQLVQLRATLALLLPLTVAGIAAYFVSLGLFAGAWSFAYRALVPVRAGG